MSEQFEDKLKHITTFIFDVDGVLTDGSVMLMENGDQIRKMNIKDGYALQLAVKKGYNIAVITGGNSEAVKKRFVNLGINNVYLGAENKQEVLEEFTTTYNIDPKNILLMGDDIPDYDILKKVGIPCCPADASEQIIEICTYVSQKEGGKGCVREVIEKTMRAQEKWFNPLSSDITEEEFLW